mmetsp:Transcript_66969/g.153428  ORF Transcript_66969/g.153428 Transcript_66969/m.153428 type:complete len:652 (+) Transcript_66969:31-1986(+)
MAGYHHFRLTPAKPRGAAVQLGGVRFWSDRGEVNLRWATARVIGPGIHSDSNSPHNLLDGNQFTMWVEHSMRPVEITLAHWETLVGYQLQVSSNQPTRDIVQWTLEAQREDGQWMLVHQGGLMDMPVVRRVWSNEFECHCRCRTLLLTPLQPRTQPQGTAVGWVQLGDAHFVGLKLPGATAEAGSGTCSAPAALGRGPGSWRARAGDSLEIFSPVRVCPAFCRLFTSHDCVELDPQGWILEASKDKNEWEVLAQTEETLPLARQSPGPWVPLVGADFVIGCWEQTGTRVRMELRSLGSQVELVLGAADATPRTVVEELQALGYSCVQVRYQSLIWAGRGSDPEVARISLGVLLRWRPARVDSSEAAQVAHLAVEHDTNDGFDATAFAAAVVNIWGIDLDGPEPVSAAEAARSVVYRLGVAVGPGEVEEWVLGAELEQRRLEEMRSAWVARAEESESEQSAEPTLNVPLFSFVVASDASSGSDPASEPESEAPSSVAEQETVVSLPPLGADLSTVSDTSSEWSSVYQDMCTGGLSPRSIWFLADASVSSQLQQQALSSDTSSKRSCKCTGSGSEHERDSENRRDDTGWVAHGGDGDRNSRAGVEKAPTHQPSPGIAKICDSAVESLGVEDTWAWVVGYWALPPPELDDDLRA